MKYKLVRNVKNKTVLGQELRKRSVHKGCKYNKIYCESTFIY